jgi:UDP-2,4-diacetamido-2,4,6-trideoxy-beta-L-altropyranose hydrolase
LLGVKQSVDSNETIKELANKKPDWLIIDHYALDYNWEKNLRPYCKKIMVIDDLANRNHDCDLLLDQNYSYNQLRYDDLLTSDTLKLLGPKYALVRNSFIINRNNFDQKNNTIKKVFVFFGGTDFNNLTLIALKALSQPKLKHLSVDVVIGSTNLHKSKLETELGKYCNVRIHIQVDNMAELMSKSDIALGAGGTTTWERMVIGIPSIVVTLADNQVDLTRDLSQDGYINWIGNADQVDEWVIYNALIEAIKNPDQLRKQACSCQNLVNGKGAKVVADLLINGPSADILVMRRAKSSDALLYWCWANDLTVRESAFNQKSIKWREHQIWFEKRLKDVNAILLILECDFGSVGQVRFDRSGSNYKIDYSIAKQFRGFGLGKEMLKKAIDYLQEKHAYTLIGEVKKGNLASKKIFEELGFSKISSRRYGVDLFQLQYVPQLQN